MANNIRIIPMEWEHVAAASELAIRVISLDKAGGEDPQLNFEAALHIRDKTTMPASHVDAMDGVNGDRCLTYFVALDGDKVVGVSGIYSVEDGYLDKFGGVNPVPGAAAETLHPKALLEANQNFYLGWLATDESMQGTGIGREMIKVCVAGALEIAKAEGSMNNQLLVIADPSAEGFYTKIGMQRQGLLADEEFVYGGDLRQMAKDLKVIERTSAGLDSDAKLARLSQQVTTAQHTGNTSTVLR